ncbi:MAG: hypothetical protein KBT04_07930, partial [Bacteroidales bacterium]|nr:hypothetical protein [Candidatus Colimorpha onthohippi]
AGYLTSFTEQQTLSAVTALGNSAGNKQLKELQDSTEAQDAVTYHLLQDVQNLIISLQQRVDSLNHVVDSINNAPAAPTAVLPSLTTTAVSDITATGAVSGGNITSDGGAAVTARGVCWGTSSTPTISSCLGKTTDGTGTGSFSSTITGLTAGTTYYVRAYATNSVGTAYGTAVSFTAQELCSNTTGGSTVTKGDNGALSGLFSVSSTKKVHFAAGNLQYTTTGTHACKDGTTKPGTWCFAANQYDYIGCGNENISSSYTGYIDLFGWGTSGYSGCNPYLKSTTSSDYGPSGYIAGTNYDWGVYNAISNGGNVTGKWRTLTFDEWRYLLNIRANAVSKRGHATVNGVHGVVLLPDSWEMPTGCTFTSGNGSGWTTNNYTTTQWAAMEGAGALFLPAAGYRRSTTVCDVGSIGDYWSSTAGGSDNAYYLYSGSSGLYTHHDYRYDGLSVRLVCESATVPSRPSKSHSVQLIP